MKTHRGCVQRRPGTYGKRTITFSFTVFLPLIKRRRRRCLNSLLLWSRNFATMVTWRHNCPLYKHRYRLMITFATTSFGYIEVLFHTLHCNWGRKYRSLYRGLRHVEFRYIEVPLYEREWEIGPTSLPRFWLLAQFAHSYPFESRIIPILPPPPLSILFWRGLALPCFIRFYMYLAIQQLFNN